MKQIKNLPAYKNLIFQEDFQSVKTVSDNGGVITGAPTINNKLTLGADSTTAVSYARTINLLTGASKATFRFKIKTPDDTNSSTALFYGYDATNYIAARIYTNKLIFYISTSLNYGSVDVSTSTNYDFTIVYNGAGADNAARLKIYSSGVAQTVTFAGTIPTTLPQLIDAYGFQIGKAGASLKSKSGTEVSLIQVWKDVALSQDEVTDLYQNDTFAELDKPQVYLPLKNQYYRETGANLLADGDMEAATAGSYTAGNSATLSKETGTRTGGTGTKVLRVAYNSVNYPYASQTILTVGRKYRVTGWMRGDGGANPSIATLAAAIVSGSSSTTWQYFDVTFTAGATGLILYCNALSAHWCEFDDIQIWLLSAQTDNIMVNKGNVLVDGNMSSDSASMWTAISDGVPSKVLGTRTGGTQKYMVRMTTVAGDSAGGGYQSVLSIGKSYKVTGYARGDGSAYYPYINANTGYSWTGQISNSWQYFEVYLIATSSRFQMLSGSAGTAGGYAEFAEVSVTEESGCLCGDGYTTTTFPTPLAGGGFSFDGGDYVRTGCVPSTTGTLACMFSGVSGATVALAGSNTAAGSRAILLTDANNYQAGGVGSQNQTTIVDSSSRALGKSQHTGILTWDGTTVNLYTDGNNCYSAAQSGTPNTTLQTYVGCRNEDGTASLFVTGNIFAYAQYNIALTPAQAKALHFKMLNSKNN